MKGLLLKDWFILLNKGKMYFVIIPVYLAFAVFQGNGFFLYFCAVFAAMIPRTFAAYDEHARWSSYTAALPLSKGQVVLARYIAAVLVLLFTIANMLVILGIGAAVFHKPELLVSLPMNIVLLTFLFSAYSAFSMPLLYRYGTEKGRVIQIVLMIAFMSLAGLVSFLAEDEAVSAVLANVAALGPAIGVLVSVLLLIASYFASVKFYRYTPNL